MKSSCDKRLVTASIVSHGHGSMLVGLVEDLLDCPEIGNVILIHNIPERVGLPRDDRLVTRTNRCPAGYGANHNSNFDCSLLPYFCVINPDIRLQGNPFPPLLSALRHSKCGVCCPCILNPSGETEDNARRFPTVSGLLLKLFGLSRGTYSSKSMSRESRPDWVAGMFMLFSRESFSAVDGFDESFFLYYEDVDICARLQGLGYHACLVEQVTAIHCAQRESRKNARFALWHLQSMGRYFLKHFGRLPTNTD